MINLEKYVGLKINNNKIKNRNAKIRNDCKHLK